MSVIKRHNCANNHKGMPRPGMAGAMEAKAEMAPEAAKPTAQAPPAGRTV